MRRTIARARRRRLFFSPEKPLFFVKVMREGQPVEGAAVRIRMDAGVRYTNQDGMAGVDLPPGVYTISVSENGTNRTVTRTVESEVLIDLGD